MGLFRSGKTLPEKAEDERARLQMKYIQIQKENADRMLIQAKRKKADELRRLTA